MNKRYLAIGLGLVLGGCAPKSDEQKLCDRLATIAKSGDAAAAVSAYDVDVRLRAAIVGKAMAEKPQPNPDDTAAAQEKLLALVSAPDAVARERDSVTAELLKGSLAEDLRAGGCTWSASASPAEAKAFALPETHHGMIIRLHNAIVDLDNLVGGMEIGLLSCPSGHSYPAALVRRREDGSPWKLLRIGLPNGAAERTL